MAKYLIDSTDIEIEEVSGTENLKFNLASGNSIEQLINNFLQISTFTLTIGAISSQDGLYDQSYTMTIPTGYIPIGIVGINTQGPYSASLTVPKMYISTDKILYSVFNTSNSTTTDVSTEINVSVLFVKDLQEGK